MILFSTKKILAVVFLTLGFISASAQQQTPLDIALRYLEQEHSRWRLEKADVLDVLVSNQYQSRHNGVTHIYFMQRHAGIPIHDAVLGVHVTATGKVGFATSRFVPNAANKVNAKAPLITALQGIIYAARQLELPGKASPVYLEQTEKNELIFEDKAISKLPIKVRLMYQLTAEGSLHLAWDMAIKQLNTPDHWSVRIDALTGELLAKDNWTVYCNFDPTDGHEYNENCTEEVPSMNFIETKQALLQQNFSPSGVDDAQYTVFPMPVESPIHGQRQLVLSPANPLASPYGWHDTNGVSGAEYRYTRGNNVHAFLDLNDRDVSSEDEPQGGTELIFNFPFSPTQEPIGLRDASVTQLFYTNNFMHDFTYQYGFDEAAGNFQKNNYGRGGNSEDYVLAQSQDGGGTNNANFNTPDDGINPTMQMYLWNSSQSVGFEVNSPASIAKAYSVGSASFGTQFSETPFSGKVVEAYDTTQQAALVCSAVANVNEVVGNIAMITRGTCTFVEKVRNAQAAGAIGVIICNVENATISMGGTGPDIRIPSVSLSASDCAVIKEQLSKGEVTVTIRYPPQRIIPAQLDASFDNGIVVHEYGHGISNRLTGGPANSNCLNNNEQMGEGWSDFFALVTTVKPDDVGSTARGIATYVNNRDTRARGIRRYAYSTDMGVNPQTLDDIIGTTSPHSLGEIWAGTLWDLYWKMVEVYGWDENIYYGTGGNNMAIQLVMDGMKLQACDPGFIDGRDAILAADLINNDGANQCLIWEVFARRGLGWSADQGTPTNRNDNREAYDVAPECAKQLSIRKQVTSLINAGEEIIVTLEVTSYKDEAATEVVVTDELPEGAAYIAGSANAVAQVVNGTIQFELGTLAPGDFRLLTYRLSTSTNNFSARQFLDDMETSGNWESDSLIGTDFWRVTLQNTFSGRRAWYVPATVRRNDQALQLATPIVVSGTQPVLRFYHNYDINPGLDGGIVQVSTNNGTTWQNVDSLLFRNGYRGRIATATFSANAVRAYWGATGEFIDSYLDLQPFIGQEILVRFRFGSQAKENSRGTGWWLDDVEIFDMYNYESEACIFSKEGDQACAMAESRGTIVQPQAPLTGTDELQQLPLQVALYPNPASDLVNIAITSQVTTDANIHIFSTDGRLMLQQTTELLTGSQTIPMRIQSLSAGFYIVEVKTANAVITQKMIVK